MRLKPWIRDVLMLLVVAADMLALALLVVDFDNWPQALVLVGIGLTLAVVEHSP